jgi:predicted RNase H-like HicB family nuclease
LHAIIGQSSTKTGCGHYDVPQGGKPPFLAKIQLGEYAAAVADFTWSKGPGSRKLPWRKSMNKRKKKNRGSQNLSGAVKIIVEKRRDGYVAYPLGLKGVVVGEGDTYEEAMTDVKSAIRFHIDTFGKGVLDEDSPVLEAFVAEAKVTT